MKTPADNYFFFLRALGLASAAGLVTLTALQWPPGDLSIAFLVLLGIMGSWLRFSLHPTGYITLMPVACFVALLLSAPYVPLLVAAIATVVGSRFFGRNEWHLATEEAGEETTSMILSVGMFELIAAIQTGVVAFFSAAATYALARVLFTIIRGNLKDDINPISTISGAGKYIFSNVMLLAIVGFGMARVTPLYSRFGLLGLSLATIALVEFYRPWKLLSERADDSYVSLAIIAEAIDIKDPYTGRHSRKVAEIAIKLARRLSLSEKDVNTIRIGALLHDIGKIGVSGAIIRKPTTLEPDEREAMQRHPAISADIMEPVELFKDAALLVRHHHEHFDGSGYPNGLEGGEIPIGSRIILVADAYDAMTTDRPYRGGRSPKEALRILREHSGKQFDPTVVRIMSEIIDPHALSHRNL